MKTILRFFKGLVFLKNKTKKTYLLIHIFQAGKFIGQYVTCVPDENIELVSSYVAHLDPRTQNNLYGIRGENTPIQVSRPSLREGYNNETEMRVMQIFSA